MKTEFSLAQLADPDIAEADKILRACVHCGSAPRPARPMCCSATNSIARRGRIYSHQEMLEKDRPPTQEVVKHIDRCLSCLACMTTCPSGVNYMHLVDQARVRIEKEYVRPLTERLLRAVLAFVLPRPGWFRAGMIMARFGGRSRPCCRHPTPRLHPLCCAESRRCWRLRRTICRSRDPQAEAFFRPLANDATGRAAAGLCPAGAGAAHQSSRHQRADAPRHRGRAGQGMSNAAAR